MYPLLEHALKKAARNKGRLVGQRPPLRLQEIWPIRIRLQIDKRHRDLALFNLAIDSKLRACDLLRLQVCDASNGDRVASRAMNMESFPFASKLIDRADCFHAHSPDRIEGGRSPGPAHLHNFTKPIRTLTSQSSILIRESYPRKTQRQALNEIIGRYLVLMVLMMLYRPWAKHMLKPCGAASSRRRAISLVA